MELTPVESSQLRHSSKQEAQAIYGCEDVTNKKKYILTFVLSIVLISSIVYATIDTITSSRPWSAAGSTGVLDESDNPFGRIWTTMPVRYDRQRVYVRSDLPSTRYKVRYRDTGANDQVNRMYKDIK